jgi:SAM-dependent methyltransferase
MNAIEQYAARVDAVVAQRTRFRGPQPEGDLFGGLSPEHPLMVADPNRPLDQNLQVLAGYLRPDDVVIDVGGGAGRTGLALARLCRELVNVDPSAGMLAGFEANAAKAGITNCRIVLGDWMSVDAPRGSVALVNHVTYVTRDIESFIRKVEAAATRRVLLTVGSPPPPTRNRRIYELVFGEPEELVPGHVELVNALWAMGIEPDVILLGEPAPTPPAGATREAAIKTAAGRLAGDQWALWPYGAELERHIVATIEAHFDELFATSENGFVPTWQPPGREVLITWPVS